MRLSPKFKISRQLFENIWQIQKLTPKQKTLVWKFQNQNRKKQSDFAKRLQRKKKLSLFYGGLPIFKMQQKKTFTYSNKEKSLLSNLEKRLDVLLVRILFCDSIFTARQWISHKKLCVNGQVVSIPGFVLTYGDIISIRDQEKDEIMSHIKKNLQMARIKPNHCEINYKILHAILLHEAQSVRIPFALR